MALMSSTNRRFSPWVLVVVAVIIVILFAVGGGLVNAFYSCLVDTTTTYCSFTSYQAGLAFISIGSLASLTWFILLIVFLVSRPPRRPTVQYNMNPAPGSFAPAQYAQQGYPQAPTYYSGQPQPIFGAQGVQYPAPAAPNKETYVTIQPLQQSAPAPPYPVQELEAPLAPLSQQPSEQRCGRCEAIVHSPFCPRCGSTVATV